MQLAVHLLVVPMVLGQTPQHYYRTSNFVVQAETAEVARSVGQSAERFRKELAKRWLDKEPSDWPCPCRIRVCVGVGITAALTDIEFAHGKVRSQQIDLQGPLDRVLRALLPHELTHVLFAHYFGVHPPRWADEGGALLSEDDYQTERQKQPLRGMPADQKWLPLDRLFAMQQYPPDVSRLYAQGHSVCRFLVDAKDRKTFLAFVKGGIELGWDQAARDDYGYENVRELEKAWLAWATIKPSSSPTVSLRQSITTEKSAATPLESVSPLRWTATAASPSAAVPHISKTY
jgi:hypothetical protein